MFLLNTLYIMKSTNKKINKKNFIIRAIYLPNCTISVSFEANNSFTKHLPLAGNFKIFWKIRSVSAFNCPWKCHLTTRDSSNAAINRNKSTYIHITTMKTCELKIALTVCPHCRKVTYIFGEICRYFGASYLFSGVPRTKIL